MGGNAGCRHFGIGAGLWWWSEPVALVAGGYVAVGPETLA